MEKLIAAVNIYERNSCTGHSEYAKLLSEVSQSHFRMKQIDQAIDQQCRFCRAVEILEKAYDKNDAEGKMAMADTLAEAIVLLADQF